MIRSLVSGSERLISKAAVWLIGLMFLSIFLLLSLSFFGYAVFLFLQNWVSPVISALIIGVVFLLAVLLGLRATKGRQKGTRQNANSDAPRKHQASIESIESILKNNPAHCLSLCIATGFLYESDPKLKEQVNSLLIGFLEESIITKAETEDTSD